MLVVVCLRVALDFGVVWLLLAIRLVVGLGVLDATMCCGLWFIRGVWLLFWLVFAVVLAIIKFGLLIWFRLCLWGWLTAC